MPPRRSAGLASCSKHVPMVTPLSDDEPDSISSLTFWICSAVKAPCASSLRIISRIRCASTMALMQVLLYCSICLRDILLNSGTEAGSVAPECSGSVHPDAAGKDALCIFSSCAEFPFHWRCLPQIAHVENEIIPCPRCPAGRRDGASAKWFRRQRSRIAITRSSRVSLI